MSERAAKAEIEVRPIRKEDWVWLSVWFRDAWLKKELGPVDQPWLDYVLAQTDGVELVAILQDQPVGIIGVTWCHSSKHFHVITSLAIAPCQRKRGLGRQVLKAAMGWSGHPPTDEWVAYVAKENYPPANLLLAMGWIEDGAQNDMRRFRFFT